MYTVEIDDMALKELDELHDYIEYTLLEPRIADKKIAQIRREIFSLSEYNNYPPVATRGFGKLHKMLVGKYNVFFIKNEYMRIIHVLHVIHTLRNWQDIV